MRSLCLVILVKANFSEHFRCRSRIRNFRARIFFGATRSFSYLVRSFFSLAHSLGLASRSFIHSVVIRAVCGAHATRVPILNSREFIWIDKFEIKNCFSDTWLEIINLSVLVICSGLKCCFLIHLCGAYVNETSLVFLCHFESDFFSARCFCGESADQSFWCLFHLNNLWMGIK